MSGEICTDNRTKSINISTAGFPHKYPQYPTSRICCICNEYEYPKSDTYTTAATWICDDCLQKIRKLLKIESLLNSTS